MTGAEMRAALVRRHVIVADEQQAIAAGVLDHNLRVACLAYALLNRQPAQRAPVAAPTPVPMPSPVPVSAPLVVSVTQRARPDNLRARLGIG